MSRPRASRWFRTFLASLLGACLLSGILPAQTPIPQLSPEPRNYDFRSFPPYRDDLPSPDQILGYQPGDYYANYGSVERVLAAYADQSDRVKRFVLGRTPELRSLYLLAISSPQNLARLDEIKANNRRLADGRTVLRGDGLDTLVRNQPLIVWVGYNVHGDEAAGTEAALQVLYQLAASSDPAIVSALEQVVVVMVPCLNPDGRERFVTWANAHGIGRAETFAFEKSNPWNVQGRYNHYYFDLNRDLLISSQPETRLSMAAFQEWLPQIAADHHGETKEYFFPPAALPINANLPQAEYVKWLERIGRGNAAAFDQQGWLYYVRDVFDVFYPGYWDSWTSLHGATGMTYETSGGGKRGRAMRRDDDTIETLRNAIAKHVVASLATIKTAAAVREERLRSFHDYFVTAVAPRAAGEIRAFLIPPARDPGRANELLGVLLRNGVEVRRTTAPVTLNEAFGYLAAEPSTREFPAGTFLVDLAQPQGRIAKALLERETPQDRAFLERQEEKRTRNEKRGKNVAKDEYEFYDVTAWSLPLTFGVEAFWSKEPIQVGSEIVTAVVRPEFAPPARANTAYVFTPETEAGLRLALQLLGEGYRLATATRPAQAGGESFMRGALIARVERNPASLHVRLPQLARELGVRIHTVNTAYAETGTTGVGSEATYTLQAPKVAVVAGPPVTPTSYGALRYLFEQTYGVDYVPVMADVLLEIRLSDFNVIVLPSGSKSGYARTFGSDAVARLKAWVEAGGTLICLGGASEWAADEKVGLTSARLVGIDAKKEAEKEKDEDDEDAEDEEDSSESAPVSPSTATADLPASPPRESATNSTNGSEAPAPNTTGEVDRDAESPKKKKKRSREPIGVPGAIMRAQVNHDHFLTFGYETDTLPVLVGTDAFFRKTKTGTNVLTFGSKDLHITGFIWRDNTERLLRNTAAVIDEPHGNGHVLLFTDEPGYRHLWHGTTRLFINGILYGPALQGTATGYFAE